MDWIEHNALAESLGWEIHKLDSGYYFTKGDSYVWLSPSRALSVAYKHQIWNRASISLGFSDVRYYLYLHDALTDAFYHIK